MANINIEDYIKEMDLSPELAEKARQCRSSSELMELAAENDLELPMDALAGVAGGFGCSNHESKDEAKCPVCGAVLRNGSPAQNSFGGTNNTECTDKWCSSCKRLFRKEEYLATDRK